MRTDSCEMSLEFNLIGLLKPIAKEIEINFLTPESKPTTITEVMKCSHHILKSIAREIEDNSKDPRVLAYFSKMLGFDKYVNEDKELDTMLKDIKCPKELTDLLKGFFEYAKKHKHENCEHE